MSRAPDIVCLSPNHWSGLATSKRHLMQVLSESGRVLFVEPPLDVFSVVGRRRRWPKLRGLRRERDSLWVLPSITATSHGDTAWLRRHHAGRLEDVRRAIGRVGLERPILWAFAPEHLEYAGALDEALLVYHVADEPSSLAGDNEATMAADLEMVERADVVLAVSERLRRERDVDGKAHLLRNAADRRHYARALVGDADTDMETFVQGLGQVRAPAELVGVDRPVVLFGGAAYDWFDTELTRELALARPEWLFVLVGPKGERLRRTSLPGNVLSVGRRPYAEFPAYVARADVTFMPVRRGQTFDTCDPIVVYEYLLCGKQVVATPFPAAREHGGFVRTALDAGDFGLRLEEALEASADEREMRRRVEYGFANTWEARAQQALAIVGEVLAGAP